MSFILDALKKSEADRQGSMSAGIADVPAAAGPSSAPRWMWALVVLLSINLLVLTVVLLRPDPTPEASTRLTPDADTRDAAASVSASTSQDEARLSPERLTELASTQNQMENPRLGQETAGSILEGDPPAQSHTQSSEASAPLPFDEAPAAETLLTFNDIRASGNVNLPDLHIDLHVYSDNPAERFIFINMNQYRESAVLSEGPRVINITPEGAILEYSGTTFLLPRE